MTPARTSIMLCALTAAIFLLAAGPVSALSFVQGEFSSPSNATTTGLTINTSANPEGLLLCAVRVDQGYTPEVQTGMGPTILSQIGYSSTAGILWWFGYYGTLPSSSNVTVTLVGTTSTPSILALSCSSWDGANGLPAGVVENDQSSVTAATVNWTPTVSASQIAAMVYTQAGGAVVSYSAGANAALLTGTASGSGKGQYHYSGTPVAGTPLSFSMNISATSSPVTLALEIDPFATSTVGYFSDATSTTDQVQSDWFGAYAVYFISMVFVIWLLRKRH